MNSNIKQVIELPLEEYNVFKQTQMQILEELKMLRNKSDSGSSTTDYLTAQEFMDACKVSRWKFDMLRDLGKLPVKQIGRKLYVHKNEINRFFNGELQST